MFFKNKNLFFISTVLVFVFFISTISKAETNYLKINYGISSHDMGTSTTTASKTSVTHDNEDEGFIVSAGHMVGDLWGIDLMYYDLGSSSLSALAVADEFKDQNGFTHIVTTAGTITNNISGYGIGFIASSNNDASESFSLDTYIKAGAHSWDKSGSTTLLSNNNVIKGSFFSQGIGPYGGLGAAFNVNDKISIDLAYDIISLSKDFSFENSSTLLSLGLRIKL